VSDYYSTAGRLASVTSDISQHKAVIEVAIRRLDTIIKEGGLPPPDLIKIDVEGAEADVLDGAKETIQNYRPILIIELHGTNKWVFERLNEVDYRALVLGDENSAIESHWCAHIVALSKDCVELTKFSKLEFGRLPSVRKTLQK
jgi:hypothetical protein